MNALIIVTVALSGPLTPGMEVNPEPILQPCSNHAALAAFEGPTTALALGSGDALGYELFAIKLVVNAD
ncbi:MAG: hypothetical protein P8M22_04910 [Phycisphaerales bacterium]|nr:hypothetical protein [Phycisphaerales bacterium]